MTVSESVGERTESRYLSLLLLPVATGSFTSPWKHKLKNTSIRMSALIKKAVERKRDYRRLIASLQLTLLWDLLGTSFMR